MILIKRTQTLYLELLLFLFLLSPNLYSQKHESDTIVFTKQYFDLIANPQNNKNLIVYPDTVILNSYRLPFVLNGRLLLPRGGIMPECPLMKPVLPPMAVSKNKLFADVHNKNELYQKAYKYYIENNIRRIKYTTADFSGEVKKIEEIKSNIFQSLFRLDYDSPHDNASKPDRFYPKRRYWIYAGNHKIQLAQNYISENWYKGGVNNLNLLNRHDFSLNYKKDKLEVNNLVEWRLNLYTNPNDTLRFHRIGEDLIRTQSNIGVQAFKNWYYSSSVEIKTQLFKNFRENSETAISSAFSPLYINLGLLGMRYQINKSYPKVKGKKMVFNTEISPMSIEYTTVLNKNIDVARFGIEEGKRHLTNYGSTIRANLKFDIAKNVNYVSRLYYFTNYSKVTAEWENTFNFPINRFFSTSIYLFFRFDDNPQLKKDKTLGYIQLNELISFGFNYSW